MSRLVRQHKGEVADAELKSALGELYLTSEWRRDGFGPPIPAKEHRMGAELSAVQEAKYLVPSLGGHSIVG